MSRTNCETCNHNDDEYGVQSCEVDTICDCCLRKACICCVENSIASYYTCTICKERACEYCAEETEASSYTITNKDTLDMVCNYHNKQRT